MRLNSGSVSFGRNESFPLRFGWIAKGLKALNDDERIFNREDATVILGVGKNMVASIRYWLQATGVAVRKRKTNALEPTPIGQIAFGNDGDPYLEDEGTIWLLHWLLATNPDHATAVYWFFNHFHKPKFTGVEVATALTDFVRHEVSSKVAVTTLKRDAQLVLRMYSRTMGGTRMTLEDALDSPPRDAEPAAKVGWSKLAGDADGSNRNSFERVRLRSSSTVRSNERVATCDSRLDVQRREPLRSRCGVPHDRRRPRSQT